MIMKKLFYVLALTLTLSATTAVVISYANQIKTEQAGDKDKDKEAKKNSEKDSKKSSCEEKKKSACD